MGIDIPLQLWNRPHWELKGRWNTALFFRTLLDTFPNATTVFVEGTSIAPNVDAFMRSAVEPGGYLPATQTIWPRAKRFRFRCDRTNMAALANLAVRHAEPELLDHLFLHDASVVLVEFPDAFGIDCPAYVSADCKEEDIRNFAALLAVDLTDLRHQLRR